MSDSACSVVSRASRAKRWTAGCSIRTSQREGMLQAVGPAGSRSPVSATSCAGLIWADILIESSGGTDPLASHGHSKADARRVKELIEDYQARPVTEEEHGQK